MTQPPVDDETGVSQIWTNAVWLGATPLLLNVISVVSAGFIARVLGIEEFGRFSMGSAMVALTFPIADCGLRALAVRQLARAGAGANRALCDLLSLRLLLATIAMLVACGIAFLVTAASGLRPVILVTAITTVPIALAGTLSDGLMARDRARAISGAVFWSGILLTAASVFAAAHWRSATGLAAAYVVGPFVNMTLLARQSRRVHGAIVLSWRPRRWRVLLRRALPFFRIGVLAAVIARLDTVVVGGLFGPGMAGVYAAATSLADRLYILVDSVASAILPALSRLRAEPKRIEETLGRVMYPLLSILTAGAMMAMPSSTAIITVIFGPAYAAGGPVLAVGLLLLPILAVDSMLAEGFLAIRRDHLVAVTGLRGHVISLILLPLLPLQIGMAGARLSRVIGYGASAAARFVASRTLFDGLWNQAQVRRFVVSVLCAAPVPCVLLLAHFEPRVAMAVPVTAFFLWCVATAGFSGGLPMLAELLKQRNSPRAAIPLPARLHPAPPRPRRHQEGAAWTDADTAPVPARAFAPRSRVSVVIPCYNSEQFIAETLNSILAQTRPADEIIVADDCSTDGSREIIARYPGVRLVTQAVNSGCASSRNLAIAAATGDLIAIIDSDDRWYPDHLETTVGLLEDFPECGFAFSGIETFGGLVETRIPDLPANVPLQILDRLLRGNLIHQPTVVFRRELYDACSGFDGSMRYCEDYDLWLQFAVRTQGVFTGTVTAGYRIHSGQLNKHFPQMFAGTWHARFKLLDTVRRRESAAVGSIEQTLSEVWVNGLYTAWAVRSRESLDFMLTLSSRFPNQHTAGRQWRQRRPAWHALVLADWVTGLMPRGVRRALRPKWGQGIEGRPAI